ncbi:MAG: hypothetical protein AAB935_01550 [Patescibacteria group bacterium]
MSRTNRFGFSLINVFLAIVIAAIIASIIIPNYLNMRDREKERKVKFNAYVCQLHVENEAARMNGSYPDSVADALNETMYKNPFGGLAFADGFRGWEAGVCYYEVAYDRKSYRITANDRDGWLFLTLGKAVH